MRRAVSLGATGIETDVRLSSDGVLVCVHDERSGWRRSRVAESPASRLGGHVPTLREVLTDPVLAQLPVSVDVKDEQAWLPLLELANELRVGSRLWCCGSLEDLQRIAGEGVGLVLSVPRERLPSEGIGPAQAVNLRWDQWDLDLLQRVRDQGGQVLAWGLKGRRGRERQMLLWELDGIYGDNVPAMVRAVEAGN